MVSQLKSIADSEKNSKNNVDREENHEGGRFCVIPSRLLRDPMLTASEKVLAAAISSLSKQCGYCYASNKYLSESCGTSEKTIESCLKSLKDKGYIDVNTKKNGMKWSRKIYLEMNPEKMQEYRDMRQELKKCLRTLKTRVSYPENEGCIVKSLKEDKKDNYGALGKDTKKPKEKGGLPHPAPPAVVVFLVNSGIQEKAAQDMLDKFGEDRTLRALEYVKQVKRFKKNMTATFRDACEKNYASQPSLKDRAQNNKDAAAKKLDEIKSSKRFHRNLVFDILSDYLEIGYMNHSHRDILKFEEHGFSDQLNNLLRKYEI